MTNKYSTEALNRAVAVAPTIVLEKVPVPRLLNPLPFELKVKLALKKFVPGFVVGTIGALTISIQQVGTAAIVSGATWLSAILTGIVSGLGLTGIKYAKETLKDSKLGGLRTEIQLEEAFEHAEQPQLSVIAVIISAAIELAKQLNIGVSDALNRIMEYTDDFGNISTEVSNLLKTITLCLQDGTITPDEILDIINSAKRLRDVVNYIRNK